MNNSNKRPVYLNLLKIRLPITGVASFLHRVSGVLLILFIPVVIYVFELSVANESGFRYVHSLLDNLAIKLLLIIVLWAILHHLFAGIRFLLLDMDVGVAKHQARFGAWIVNIGAMAITAVIVGVML